MGRANYLSLWYTFLLDADPRAGILGTVAKIKGSTSHRQIRRAHPAIERKLADMVRRHAGRWARYRGRACVRIPYLLTGLVVNVKRMVQLLVNRAPSRAAPPEASPVAI